VATEYINDVAGSIIEQLKAGTAPWVKPWQPGERFMPYNPTSGNEYRGMNAIWLLSRAEARGHSDARWMTYRQAQARDAQVRKGEKGTVIQYWKWQGTEPVRDENGAPVLDAEGTPQTRIVRYERPRVWAAVVFNAEQIDGLAAPADRPVLAEWERHKQAETILANSQASIRHVPGDLAVYKLSEDRIVLPERGQFPTADRYYATALHELGHWTGHPSRLNRDIAHPFGSEAYAREELRAEIASLMLGEQLGIGHDPGQHVAYVGSWIRTLQEDLRELFRAAADAEKITKLLRSFELTQEQRAEQGVVRTPSESELEQPPETAAVRPPVLVQENHPAMRISDDRTYLAVPYDEKDDAKQLGARWDRQVKAWYVPAGVDLEAFTPWLPAMGQVHIAVDADPRDEFAAALRECGLQADGPVQMDGQLHRVPVEGDKGKERSGAYIGHLDGRPAGFIQNFKTGQRLNWKASGQAAALGAQDRARLAAEAAQKRHDRAQERERQYERTAQEVEAIWAAATPCAAHPYLDEKGIASHGLRQGDDGRLLVPVQDADGKLWSVQHIADDGFKQFQEGGRVEGGHFVIGQVERPGPILIAEGYATAATLHELSHMPAVVAFNAYNLMQVARTYRALYPERAIYVAGDNDHQREAEGKPNVGRAKAEEAAAAIGGFTLLPMFAGLEAGSDWNDLAQANGRDAARQQFIGAVAIAEREQIVQSSGVAAAPTLNRAESLAPAHERGRNRSPKIEMGIEL